METDTRQEMVSPVDRVSYEADPALAQQLYSDFSLQTVVDNIKKATLADVVTFYLYNRVNERLDFPPYVSGTLLNADIQEAMYPVQPHLLPLLNLHTEPLFATNSEDLYYLLHDDTTSIPQYHFYQREQVCSTAVVPLSLEGKVVGVLFVNFRQTQEFDPRQRELIESLAYYAAISIRMSQALNALSERRIHELAILQSIEQELNTNLDLTEVLSTILQLAYNHVPASQAAIMVLMPGQESFTIVVRIGHKPDEDKDREILPVDILGITRWVMEHKRSVRVNDVHRDRPWCDIYAQVSEETIDTVSELAVPLIDGDEVIGVLNFEGRQEGAFRQEDQQFVEALAGQAVLSIKRSQAFESEKKAAERFELLYEAGQELGKVVDHTQLDQAYDTIVRIAQKQSQSPVVIRRYEEDAHELVVASASPYRYSPPTPRLKIDQSFHDQNGQTVVIHDINHIPPQYQSTQVADPTLISLVIAPITFKDQYYGDLELSHGQANYFRDADIAFFEALAQQLAGSIYRLEITQDRQEFEQRARAAEEMSTIGHSTFELVHRLGNSLGLVGYYINAIQEEMQMKGVTSEPITEKLEQINLSASSVLQLSNQLRQKVAATAAETLDEPVLLSPQVLLDEALSGILLPANIKMHRKVEPDAAEIRVYPNLVVDSLHNLIINAIQAMPEGGELTCSIYNRVRSVVFEIKDTGMGIPPEQQSKIFDLFHSTKSSSGFGLWSARRNALKNHGKLKLQNSVPGGGTTFVLLFPKGMESLNYE